MENLIKFADPMVVKGSLELQRGRVCVCVCVCVCVWPLTPWWNDTFICLETVLIPSPLIPSSFKTVVHHSKWICR